MGAPWGAGAPQVRASRRAAGRAPLRYGAAPLRREGTPAGDARGAARCRGVSRGWLADPAL